MNVRIFRGPVHTIVAVYSTIQFKLCLIRPDNFPANALSSRIMLSNHSQYSSCRSGSSSFIACSILGMYTFHFALFKIRCTLDRLTPVSREHCFTDFCGERVNCCNTAAEVARVVAVRGCPDLALCPSPKVPSISNLSRIRAIVRRVGGCVPNSFHYCRCTSLMYSNLKYHFSTALRSSDDSLAPAMLGVTVLTL